jgi:hypothetical protein
MVQDVVLLVVWLQGRASDIGENLILELLINHVEELGALLGHCLLVAVEQPGDDLLVGELHIVDMVLVLDGLEDLTDLLRHFINR